MRSFRLFSLRTGFSIALGLGTSVGVALVGALWYDPGPIMPSEATSFPYGEGSSYALWKAKGPLCDRLEGFVFPRDALEEWAERANTQFERHGYRGIRGPNSEGNFRRAPVVLIDADEDRSAAEKFAPWYAAVPDARHIDTRTAWTSTAVGWPWRAFVAQGEGSGIDVIITAMPVSSVSYVPEYDVLLVKTPWKDTSYRHGFREIPLRPIPVGLALNTLCYGAVWWPLLGVPIALRGRLRTRARRCAACGYDLAGINPAAECPECGSAR